MKDKLLIILLISCFCCKLASQEKKTALSVNGQLTSWGIGQFNQSVETQFGCRFVPSVTGCFRPSASTHFDFEASLNTNGTIGFNNLTYDSIGGKIKPYRFWMRYSHKNWEIRAGLQKINFGSAKLFRPLMWFDGMDVRDPLQLTDGVYGVLGRYYFKNNANIWLWTLIGNNDRKGYEIFGTPQWKPEVGGRLQLPAGKGEMALSTNYRKIQLPDILNHSLLNESRFGLDGKWDIGIGLWFESSITFTQKSPYFNFPVQEVWNIGTDYTFALGNGLGITVEYFRYHAGSHFMTGGTALNLIGSMFTYPVSVLDNLSAMVFYIAKSNLWCNYLSWSRIYDNWSFYAIGFWNPDNFQLLGSQMQNNKNLYAGKGIQLMVNYNF